MSAEPKLFRELDLSHALAAASLASDAVSELLRFVREGEGRCAGSHFDFDTVSLLLDAARMVMEIEGWDVDPAERGLIYVTIAKATEGA